MFISIPNHCLDSMEFRDNYMSENCKEDVPFNSGRPYVDRIERR